MVAIGIIFALLGAVGGIWCLVEAFSEDVTQGILCLCIPLYALYFVIAKIEPPKKWIILSLMIVGVVGRVIVAVAN
jgi:hypothetical protein